MNQTNTPTAPAELAECFKKIGSTAKSNNNQLSFAEMKAMLTGMTLNGTQIDQLWRFLDSNRILLFHIDEDDVLFKGIAPNKTVYIEEDSTNSQSKDAPRKKGFFFRKR